MIEEVITLITNVIEPKCNDGLLYDMEHYFGRSKYWSESQILQKNDKRCLVELRAYLSQSVSSIQQLQEILYAIWDKLKDRYLSAESLLLYRQAALLRFVSIPESKKYCITGVMVVSGKNYENLALTQQTTGIQQLVDYTGELQLEGWVKEPENSNLQWESGQQSDDETLGQIRGLIEKLNRYTEGGKNVLVSSDVHQDALLFTLSTLMRLIGKLAPMHAAQQWRSKTAKLIHPSTNPWLLPPEKIWSIAIESTRELNQYFSGCA